MPGYDSATQMTEMTTTVTIFPSYVFASQFAFGQWFLQPWLGYSIVYGRLFKCALSHRPHSNLTNLSEKLLHPWTERVTMTIKYLATTKKKTLSYVQVITHYERGKMVQGFVDKFILD